MGYEHLSNDELIEIIKKQNDELKRKKYGLVWESERENEKVVLDCAYHLPILKCVDDKTITTDTSEDNILIEGDNYHALSVLSYTHKEKIDVIYIDPPYNTGENDFKYNDKYVEEEDKYKHSKWLNFMEKRLNVAKDLLAKKGVIIVHIDEHEASGLHLLISRIFGEENNLGTIIWNKKNPKGDSKGVSAMHETILCFAKNKSEFLAVENVLKRKKANAEKILKKASQLFKKLGKTAIPDEIKEVIKPFDFSKEILNDFNVTYDLELINKEFQNWLSRQDFSNGEKAYKFIDQKGKVYRGVSMAWPNKKQAPDEYFIPLIHPVTQLPCPVPQRGWRNPPATMQKFLEQNLILFGDDETKQPERKYQLEDNMDENTSSVYENGLSDDDFFTDIDIAFPYPKPVSASKYLLSSIYPQANLILDFFAGSGTTGHAVLDLNAQDGRNRRFILCTNNENGICENVTHPRLKKVIRGYSKSGNGEMVDGLGGNLRYFKTALLKKSKSIKALKNQLTRECIEMLCVKENIYNLTKKTKEYKIFLSNDESKSLCVYFDTTNKGFSLFVDELKMIQTPKSVYVFSNSLQVDPMLFIGVKNFTLEAIPQKILDVYKRLVKLNIPLNPEMLYLDFDKARKRVFEEKDKDDGARLLRVILEKTIEKIASSQGINITEFTELSRLNDHLKQREIFTKVLWEENKTYIAIGNHAAHGDHDEYDYKQVENFYRHIQNLIDTFIG